jgi:4-carboxymuconolactone decarboxylase
MTKQHEETTGERRERGLDALEALTGRPADESLEHLGDHGRYIAEFAYGDIHSRDGLEARERQIATIAMLTALGGRERQLRLHIEASLNLGMSSKEIEEIIIHTVPYAGFPGAINAVALLKEVLAERAAKRRLAAA